MAFTYLDLQRFLVAKRHHRLHPAERPSRNAAGSELRRYSAGLKLLLAFRRQREGSTHVRRALEMNGSDQAQLRCVLALYLQFTCHGCSWQIRGSREKGSMVKL